MVRQCRGNRGAWGGTPPGRIVQRDWGFAGRTGSTHHRLHRRVLGCRRLSGAGIGTRSLTLAPLIVAEVFLPRPDGATRPCRSHLKRRFVPSWGQTALRTDGFKTSVAVLPRKSDRTWTFAGMRVWKLGAILETAKRTVAPQRRQPQKPERSLIGR